MRIFQGYFDEASRQRLDPSAEPLDISFNLNHPLYEYNIFRTLLDKGVMNPDAGPVGLLSWKFQTKALVNVRVLADFCGKAFAAGADVVFINPMIACEAMYKSVWEQGEHAGHAGMLDIAGALFPQDGLGRIMLMPQSVFAFCNYFVGNRKFWSAYMAFCDGVLSRIEALKDTNPPVFARIYGSANYYRNTAADFRPFILERLFSTFLLLHRDIIAAPLLYAPDMYERKFGEKNGRYLHDLSRLKNDGIRTGDVKKLEEWHRMRLPLLNDPEEIWFKDDPQPAV